MYVCLCRFTINSEPALPLGRVIENGDRYVPRIALVAGRWTLRMCRRSTSGSSRTATSASRTPPRRYVLGGGKRVGRGRRAGQARHKPYSRIIILSLRREVIVAVGNRRLEGLRMVVPCGTAPCWHLGARLRTCFAVANTLHPACYRLHVSTPVHTCFHTCFHTCRPRPLQSRRSAARQRSRPDASSRRQQRLGCWALCSPCRDRLPAECMAGAQLVHTTRGSMRAGSHAHKHAAVRLASVTSHSLMWPNCLGCW